MTTDDGGQGKGPARPARRPRYPGKNPRRFEDKHKELDPERHPDVVARVLSSGKTPAGSHRPIMVDEILEVLAPRPGEVAVDATLGHGGHALALLPRLMPGGRLVAIDADPIELPRAEARLRAAGFGPDAAVVVHSNMAALPAVLAAQGLARADAVVADLGCSSMQLDDPSRGFTFKGDGPLDLRMNPRKGMPASELLARLPQARLSELLDENADEQRAARIAESIVRARERAPLLRTTDLALAVRAALPRSADASGTLARVFQAVRIAVNDELSSLDAFLRALPACVAPGGRVAVLTFHSGEDRRVKQALLTGWRDGTWREIAREVRRPGRQELRDNPRAASAKLRWAIRSEAP